MDADEKARVIPNVEDVVDNTGKRLNQQPAYDKLIHAEIAFQLEENNVAGKVKGRTDTARPLCTDEIYNNNEEKRRKVFDELIELRWGSSLNFLMNATKTKDQEFEEYSDADEEAWVIPGVEDVFDNTVKRIIQQPAYDKLIHAEIAFQLEENNVPVKVKGRKLGPDGRTAGIYHEDPILNNILQI